MTAAAHYDGISTAAASLPNLIVIGAMKAGTSAMHNYLDNHPEIAMSEPKELNFFFEASPGRRFDVPSLGRKGVDGRHGWSPGNWHRGLDWYMRHFLADVPVRGESSPGYTSPSHPRVAERMAAIVPYARIVYMVRDPVARALSHYRHHVRDGEENRSPAEALLDPGSQYISRGRYMERLGPFVSLYHRDQIAIVAHEQLVGDRRGTLQRLFSFLGVQERFWCDGLNRPWRPPPEPGPFVPEEVVRRLADEFRDDLEALERFAGRRFPWSLGAPQRCSRDLPALG